MYLQLNISFFKLLCTLLKESNIGRVENGTSVCFVIWTLNVKASTPTLICPGFNSLKTPFIFLLKIITICDKNVIKICNFFDT